MDTKTKRFRQFKRGDLIEVINDNGWGGGPWKGTIAICEKVVSTCYWFTIISGQRARDWNVFTLDREQKHRDVKIIGRAKK